MLIIAPPTAKHRALARKTMQQFEKLVQRTPDAEAYDYLLSAARDLASALVAEPHTSTLGDWLLMARWCVLVRDGFHGAHCHEAIARLTGDRAADPAIRKVMNDLKRGHYFDEYLAKARQERPAFMELYDRTLAGKGDAFAVGCAYGEGTPVLRCAAAESMWYHIAAKQGHAGAMVKLAKQLYHGLGIPQDEEAAFQWLHKAAKLGNTAACAQVSHYYRDGSGCKQSTRKAAFWMERAAAGDLSLLTDASRLYEKFNPAKAIECLERAITHLLTVEGGSAGYWMNELATIYREHKSVRDLSKAIHWLHRAAEQGEAQAMAELGWMYDAGIHVPRAPIAARQWLEKACLAQDWNGKVIADRFAEGTDGTERDDAAARHFYQLAGEGGDYSAWIELALFHYEGRGGRVDHEQAEQCLKRAMEKNARNWSIALSIDSRETLANRHELAYPWYKRAAATDEPAYGLQWLGTYYLYGWGGRKDAKRAEKYFERWMKVRPHGMGNRSHPIHEIGDLYATGDCGEGADDATAVSWYRRGAKVGESSSLVRLGLFMTAGRGVKHDTRQATELFEKAVACSRGEASEAFMIGCCFREGVIVPRNEPAAKKWLKRAAKDGEDDAARLLANSKATLDISRCDYDMRMLWEFWSKLSQPRTKRI